MFEDEDHGCGRIGRWIGLLCAGLGLATAVLMWTGLGLTWHIGFSNLPLELIVGFVALFVGAGYLGTKAGVFLCERRHALSMCMVAGIGVALGSIAIAVWTSTFLGILRNAHEFFGRNFTVLSLVLAVFGPLGLVLLFGGIPAMLLGVLYGFLVKRGLRRLPPVNLKSWTSSTR